jgi:hypothetical protein
MKFKSIKDLEERAASLGGGEDEQDIFPEASEQEASASGGNAEAAGAGGENRATAPEPAVPSDQPGAETEVPSYVPSYKFKFGESEVEVDERLRPVIKDKDTEEFVRGLYQRYHEFDPIKTERDRLSQHYAQIQDSLNNLVTWRSSNPLGFLKAAGFSEQDIVQVAQSIVNFKSLPPEQQKAYADQVKQRDEYTSLQSQFQQLQKTNMATAAQLLDLEFDQIMSQPDVTSAARSYDERVGKTGAFKHIFFLHGSQLSNAQGTTVPPRMVLDSLRSAYPGLFAQAQTSVAAPAPVAAAPLSTQKGATAAPATSQKKPANVIPNLGGSSAAPVARRRFNSIAEMEEYNRKMAESEE